MGQTQGPFGCIDQCIRFLIQPVPCVASETDFSPTLLTKQGCKRDDTVLFTKTA